MLLTAICKKSPTIVKAMCISIIYLRNLGLISVFQEWNQSRNQAFTLSYSAIFCMTPLHLSPHICKTAAIAPSIISLYDSIPIKKEGRKKKYNKPFSSCDSSGRKIIPEVLSKLCVIFHSSDLGYMSSSVLSQAREQEASVVIHPSGWVNCSPEWLLGRQQY